MKTRTNRLAFLFALVMLLAAAFTHPMVVGHIYGGTSALQAFGDPIPLPPFPPPPPPPRA